MDTLCEVIETTGNFLKTDIYWHHSTELAFPPDQILSHFWTAIIALDDIFIIHSLDCKSLLAIWSHLVNNEFT